MVNGLLFAYELIFGLFATIAILLVGLVWGYPSLPIPSAFPAKEQIGHYGLNACVAVMSIQFLVFFAGDLFTSD